MQTTSIVSEKLHFVTFSNKFYKISRFHKFNPQDLPTVHPDAFNFAFLQDDVYVALTL